MYKLKLEFALAIKPAQRVVSRTVMPFPKETGWEVVLGFLEKLENLQIVLIILFGFFCFVFFNKMANFLWSVVKKKRFL